MKKINTIALILSLSQDILERSKKPFNKFRASAGLILLISLFTAPVFSGPNCIDKQEQFLDCPCNCNVIKGRHCIECSHLQDARPITVIEPKENSAIRQRSRIYNRQDPQTVLEQLATQYVENKYNV